MVEACRRASAVVHRAMRETGAGQLLDLVFTAGRLESVEEADILEAYRLKTAHFAFEAPLRSGAILAGAPSKVENASARASAPAASPVPTSAASTTRPVARCCAS